MTTRCKTPGARCRTVVGRSIVASSAFALVGLSAFTLSACLGPSNKLAQVKMAGELVVLTRNSPTTYYEGPDGPQGIEYDLAKAFADSLGVTLKLRVVASDDILPQLLHGGADLAAAGLVVTPERAREVRFGPTYEEIQQQVVYRLGTDRPADLPALQGHYIEVTGHSSYAERLRALQARYPGLTWGVSKDTEVEDLLVSVWQGLIDFTVADSNTVALMRQYYPELQVAFGLGKPAQLAWAFPPDGDDSLYQAATAFFAKMRKSGEINRLIERYYGPAQRFNYVNITSYIARIKSTLPAYRTLFKTAGKRYNLDWRLLAAVAYQESLWDADAVSPTGVRGMMMLTHDTSSTLGVTDREDPLQSIEGGARYLRAMIDRIPERIPQPDRVWMALAAYNVGLNHLDDARMLTQETGGDQDRWVDVEKRLPLLANENWYRKTRYGYARGYEPVQYVRRIRTYYNILVKLDEEEKAKNAPAELHLRVPVI